MSELMKKFILSILILSSILIAGINVAKEAPYILLQSTTSTKNSGLYDYILPKFKEESGVDVRVVAVGTGQAIKNAQNGDADLLIVHAKSREEKFVQEGYGIKRHELMYNDFIIVGPKNDPAGALQANSVRQALTKIAEAKEIFVSRGDDSGTHIKEQSLWELADVNAKSASGTWYREAGAGMGATLNTAVSMDAYALTDRSTWISFGNKQDHIIVFQDKPPLHNQYSVIVINPERHPHVKRDLAYEFVQWLLSDRGQTVIADYTVQGQQLFFPNAKN